MSESSPKNHFGNVKVKRTSRRGIGATPTALRGGANPFDDRGTPTPSRGTRRHAFGLPKQDALFFHKLR
jgi:hypothetical protein